MSALDSLRRAAHRAVSIEVWVLVALASASGIFAGLLLPALVVAALFWPLRWLARGRLSLPTPLDWPAGLMALMLPVSLLVSPLPDITLPQVYRVLVGLALCYAFANHAWSLPGLRAALAQIVGLGVGLTLGALLIVSWPVGKLVFVPMGFLRDLPQGLIGLAHPNLAAGTLVLFVLLGPAWLLFGGRQVKWWGRILLLLAAALIFAVLLLTKSRGAWLGLAAGLVLLVVLRWPRWGLAALLLLGLAGVVLLVSRPALLQALLNDGGDGSVVNTLQGREAIWTRSILQIEQFPLTGFGMGTFSYVSYALYPSFTFVAIEAPHAHNLYLQIAVDLGLPGLAAWLVMVCAVLRCAWQVYRAGLRRRVGLLAGLGAGLLAGQAAMLVHGLVDAATWGNRLAVIVWGFWGFAIAAWLFVRRTSVHDSPAT